MSCLEFHADIRFGQHHGLFQEKNDTNDMTWAHLMYQQVLNKGSLRFKVGLQRLRHARAATPGGGGGNKIARQRTGARAEQSAASLDQ